MFVTGYLVTWAAAGAVGYAVFAIFDSLDIGFLAWDEAGQYVAGGVILAAAIYQLTPLKDACLTQVPQPIDVHPQLLAAGSRRARCGWGSSTAPGASAAAGR